MICLLCGKTATELHHFISRGASAKLINVEENKIPLCFDCHRRTHQDIKFNGKQNILEIKGKDWLKNLNKIRYGNSSDKN